MRLMPADITIHTKIADGLKAFNCGGDIEISRVGVMEVANMLSFRLEYDECHQYSSTTIDLVDGLVLLKHLNTDILQQHLGIKNPIHVTKLFAEIDRLKRKKVQFDELIALQMKQKSENEAAEKDEADQRRNGRQKEKENGESSDEFRLFEKCYRAR